MTAQQARTAPSLGRQTLAGVIGLVGLTLVGVVTWFVVHDPPRHAHAGDLVTGYISSTEPTQSVVVREPWGRVDVQVGSPTRSLPRAVAYEQGNLRAPDGGRFVGVQWTGSTLDDERTVALAPYPRTHVSLVADGRSFPLDTPTVAADPCEQAECVGERNDEQTYVAVPNDASRLAIAVEFDGVTQTVDVATKVRHPGLAAGLYRSTVDGTLGLTCSAVHLPAGFRLGDADGAGDGGDTPDGCPVVAYRSPYAPGRGWARSGTEWVVTTSKVTVPSEVVQVAQGARPAAEYRTSDDAVIGPAVVRLAGALSGGPLLPADGDLTDHRQTAAGVSVFAVPASAPTGALTVTSAVPLVPAYRDTLPSTVRPTTITLSWTATP